MPPSMILDRRFREVAPDAFAFPGDNFYEIGGTDDFLRWAFPLFKHGADGFYCSGSLATVKAMAAISGSSMRGRRWLIAGRKVIENSLVKGKNAVSLGVGLKSTEQ